MKTHDKNTEEEKSLSGKKEDVKEQMGNFLEEKETAPEDEGAKDDEDILMKYGGNPAGYSPPRGVAAFSRGGTGGGMSSGGAGGGPLRRSLFTSVALSKSGSMCASKPQKKDEGPLWKPGESVPEKLHEEPEGEYVPEGWSAKGEEDDDKKKKKDVKKSLFASVKLSKAKGPQERLLEQRPTVHVEEGGGAQSGKDIGKKTVTSDTAAKGWKEATARQAHRDPWPNRRGVRPITVEGVPYKPSKAAVKQQEAAKAVASREKAASTAGWDRAKAANKRKQQVWEEALDANKDKPAELKNIVEREGPKGWDAFKKWVSGKGTLGPNPFLAKETADLGGRESRARRQKVALSDPRPDLPSEEWPGWYRKASTPKSGSEYRDWGKRVSDLTKEQRQEISERGLTGKKDVRLKGKTRLMSSEEESETRGSTAASRKASRLKREEEQAAATEKQVQNKSLTESRYGSQLSRNHDVGKSCGMCGRVSKSCGEHGCCEDCKKSMSATLWHESHLA